MSRSELREVYSSDVSDPGTQEERTSTEVNIVTPLQQEINKHLQSSESEENDMKTRLEENTWESSEGSEASKNKSESSETNSEKSEESEKVDEHQHTYMSYQSQV